MRILAQTLLVVAVASLGIGLPAQGSPAQGSSAQRRAGDRARVRPAVAAGSVGSARSARSQGVVVGHGNQVAPSPCRLPSGVLLLAFERIFSASESRVYVKRRRPGFGWSFGRPVPLLRGDQAQRHPSLVCRPDGTVLLYVQVGDRRRGRGRVRVYRSRGDSLQFTSAARWSLPSPGVGPGRVGAPCAAPQPGASRTPPVWITVTRLTPPRSTRGGCYLGLSPDGVRPPSLSFTGPGQRCCTIALSQRLLVQTYVRRPRLTLPLRAYLRRSGDGGRTWSAPVLVSPVREAVDPSPVPPVSLVASRRPPQRMVGVTSWASRRRSPLASARPRLRHGAGKGRGAVIFIARLEGKSAVLARPLDSAGRLGSVRRLTPWTRLRWRQPAGLGTPGGTQVYVAREVRPLDFDVVHLGARAGR